MLSDHDYNKAMQSIKKARKQEQDYDKAMQQTMQLDETLNAGAVVNRNDVIKYWGFRSSIAVGPPMIGYAVLFAVLPWIGRGFVKNQPPS